MRIRILTLVSLLMVGSGLQAGDARRLLLLAQKPDGHPPMTHEYRAGLAIVQKMLAKQPGIEVKLVMADEPWPEGPELLKQADGAVVFLSQGAQWLSNNPKRLAAFRELAKRKGGLSVIHWGMGTKDAKNIDAFTALFGACHGGPDRKYKVVKATAKIASPQHPAVQGLKDFDARDEFYYDLKVSKLAKKIVPLIRVHLDGKDEMVGWAWQRPDGGRSFGFSGLHFHNNWQLPEYRRLIHQGVVWTMQNK